jgi:hypothetical protein
MIRISSVEAKAANAIAASRILGVDSIISI